MRHLQFRWVSLGVLLVAMFTDRNMTLRVFFTFLLMFRTNNSGSEASEITS